MCTEVFIVRATFQHPKAFNPTGYRPSSRFVGRGCVRQFLRLLLGREDCTCRAGAPRGLECGHTTSFGVSSNCFKSAPEKNIASRTKANSRVKLCTVNGSVFGAKISESEATRERKNLSEKAKCATIETRITIRVNA